MSPDSEKRIDQTEAFRYNKQNICTLRKTWMQVGKENKQKGVKNVGRYIVKRILLAILTVLIICAITFFVMNAIPGGPFNREKALSAATIEALNKRYNLDKPVGEQFILYMKNLLHGDFGVSLKNGRDIKEIIAESFPISAKLGLMAIGVALVCGTVFGSLAALMRNKWPDRVIVFFSTLFTAVPSFVLATLLLLVFCTSSRGSRSGTPITPTSCFLCSRLRRTRWRIRRGLQSPACSTL